MNPAQRTHALRDLDKLSIENLTLGRITRIAMQEAAKRLGEHLAPPLDRELADELNDMLEAAREEDPFELKGDNDGH